MKCGTIREELMEAVLSGPELATAAVQEHMATCAACAQEVASLRETMNLLDEWRAPEPSPYFGARLRAHLREEQTQQSRSWLVWLRRPAVVTAAVALMALGVGMLEGVRWNEAHHEMVADVDKGQPQIVNPGAPVSDLQYLDSHADLFTDFDALDDNQTEAN